MLYCPQRCVSGLHDEPCVMDKTTTIIEVEAGPNIPDCLKNITSGLAALDMTATSIELTPIAPTGPGKGNASASQVFPRHELTKPGEPLVVDIEFQDYHIAGEKHPMDHRDEDKRGKRKCRNRLAWICVRNVNDDIILDCFVRYEYGYTHVKRILNEHHAASGITAERLMERNGAVDGRVVECWCVALSKDRPIVLHGGSNDLKAFYYEKAFAGASEIIDAQHIHGQRSLSGLYYELFGEEIQQGGNHAAVEDTAFTDRDFKLSSSYDREAEQTRCNMLSDAEKDAYYAAGPVAKYEHYQGDEAAGMPARFTHPEYTVRESRAYKGKGKERATEIFSSDKTDRRRNEYSPVATRGKVSAGNITLSAHGIIALPAGRDTNINFRGNAWAAQRATRKTTSKSFSFHEDEFPALEKK